MKIGSMIFEIYGELLFPKAVEFFITTIDHFLLSISDNFNSDYRRFGFFATVLRYEIELKIFWKNDTFYNTLKKYLSYCFDNWTIDITLNTYEEGE